MTIAHEAEVRIGRAPADVFAHLADIERWPEWLTASGIVRVERLGDGPLAAGSPVRIEQRVAGRTSTLDASVTGLDAPSRLALSARDGDGVSVEIEATVEPDGAGSRLGWRLRIGLPLRFRMFESMAAPQVRRAVALDLEAFRRRMESIAQD